MQSILEGSRAIALTIKNIGPAVVSAYPITPQTHIVEDLAKFKADGEADYEYVRAESEFAAASIVEGASATGVRVYSATSSQGLLLMAEVIFNIAGMRLPVVLTCANRGVSAPITIWNDHQDAMTIRDAGWIMFFAENHQESVSQHIMA
ncbi:MAG: pyruvate ferredoxin oxidoreductase, partial [Patescibacteria group bacterium]